MIAREVVGSRGSSVGTGAQGQRTASLASIQASLTGQVAATAGSATTQRMIIQAAAGVQKSQVGAEVGRGCSADQLLGPDNARKHC